MEARQVPLAIEASKANVGHAEMAAGQVALLLSVQAVKLQNIVANAQLRTVNRLVHEQLSRQLSRQVFPIVLGLQASVLAAPSNMLHGLNSFGYSGTIANALLQPCLAPASLPSQTTFRIPWQRRVFGWQDDHQSLSSRSIRKHLLMPLSDPLCALSLTALTLVHRIGHRPGPSLVRLHRDESASVGVLELHDPKRLNGLSEALYVDILDAAHAITRLGDFRAVVIQGSGPHFCSGGSLDLLNLAAVGSPFQVALDLNARTCLAVNELRKVQLPMACAVQGKVIGGGLAVAGVADYLVSDARATFWLRNLSLGMSVIGCLSLTLPSRAGLSRALGFYLSNELLTVDGAQHLGLVDEIIHNGTDATQCRALQVAHVLAQDNVQASIFLQARVDISPLYAAAEMGRAAASMASFPGDNPEAARALFAVGHSHAPSKTPKLINFDLGASHSLPKAEPVVRTVDVSAFVLENPRRPADISSYCRCY
jgi:2-(1,2-epoxy-1,2-dihydrophenyl)acetyl-CoA isomerase